MTVISSLNVSILSSFESLMLFDIIGGVDTDSLDLIYFSMGAALINTVIQLNKMILEAKELDEDILDYL